MARNKLSPQLEDKYRTGPTTSAGRGLWDRLTNPKPEEKPVINQWLRALKKYHTETAKQSGRRKLWNPEENKQGQQKQQAQRTQPVAQGKSGWTTKGRPTPQHPTREATTGDRYAQRGDRVKSKVGNVRLVERTQHYAHPTKKGEDKAPLITNRTVQQRQRDKTPARVGQQRAYGPNASKALAASMTASGPPAEMIKLSSEAQRAKAELQAAKRGERVRPYTEQERRQQRINNLEADLSYWMQRDGELARERAEDIRDRLFAETQIYRDLAKQKLLNQARIRKKKMNIAEEQRQRQFEARQNQMDRMVDLRTQGNQQQAIPDFSSFQDARNNLEEQLNNDINTTYRVEDERVVVDPTGNGKTYSQLPADAKEQVKDNMLTRQMQRFYALKNQVEGGWPDPEGYRWLARS